MSWKDIQIAVNGRGFQIFGDPVQTDRRYTVEVYESSAAEAPHVWLRISGGPEVAKPETLLGSGPEEDITVHLSLEQAEAVRDRLNAFIKGVPARWGGPWAKSKKKGKS